jgi:hypothetical protein
MKSARYAKLLFFTFLYTASALFSGVFAEETLSPEQEQFLWDNPELVGVTSEEMAFTYEDFEHIKNQSVFIMARFDNGWVLMLSYFWVRGGVINNWGIYVGVSDPEGNGYFYKHKLNTRDMEFSEDQLYLSDGVNIFRGNEDFYSFRVHIDGFACNLTYLNVLPPWKPGDGVDFYDEEKTAFDKRAVISPWADVQGTMEVDGREMQVTGQGFAEKQMTINSFFKLNPQTITLRLFSLPGTPREERWHIGILENSTHEDYGNERLPRLTAAKGEEWVLTTMDYEITPENFRENDVVPYNYPTTLRISSSRNGYKIEGTYYGTKLYNITDIIGELPKFFQAFVLLFMERPVYFRMIGEFYGCITFPDGTRESVHLYGPYEYIVVK